VFSLTNRTGSRFPIRLVQVATSRLVDAEHGIVCRQVDSAQVEHYIRAGCVDIHFSFERLDNGQPGYSALLLYLQHRWARGQRAKQIGICPDGHLYVVLDVPPTTHSRLRTRPTLTQIRLHQRFGAAIGASPVEI